MTQSIKKILCRIDLFSVPPLLRSRSQPMIGSLGLGLCSLALFSIFLWLFMKNVISSINMDSSQIKFRSSNMRDFDKKNISNIMFGLSFKVIDSQNDTQITDIAQIKRYYDIRLQYLNGTRQEELIQCNPQLWALLGEDYKNNFKQNSLETCFCPTKFLTIVNSTQYDNFIKLSLKPCIGKKQCYSLQKIKQSIQKVMKKYLAFPIFLNFLNPIPQVDQSTPITYAVENKKYFFSGKTTVVYLQFNKFIIKTEKSIIPYIPNFQVKTLYHLDEITHYRFGQFNITNKLNNAIFIFNGVINSNVVTYNRQVYQIDWSMSYVGGILSIVLIFFSFVLGNEATYRYEIRTSETSFNYDSDGYKIRQKDLTVWMYIKYSILTWVDLLFCCELNWQKCKEMDETREEGINILMVQNLFRRLQFLETALWEQQICKQMMFCVALFQLDTIDKLKKKRNVLQYYRIIVKMQKAASVQDAINGKQKAFEYLQEYKKELNLNSTDNNETEWQIKQSLKFDLNLSEFEYICESISKYPLIAFQAKNINLSHKKQFEQIQQQMAKALFDLQNSKKQKALKKIPIVIIHRLRFKSQKLQLFNNLVFRD